MKFHFGLKAFRMGLKDILYFCMHNLALCFKLIAPYEPNHKAGYHIMVLVTCETCSLRVLLARLKCSPIYMRRVSR